MKQRLLTSTWFKNSVYATAAAILLTLMPFAPIGIAGAVLLLTALPGVQWVRWLGLYRPDHPFQTITLSVALGMVTSPILIYWSGLLFGYPRWLLQFFFALYLGGRGGGVGKLAPPVPPEGGMANASPPSGGTGGLESVRYGSLIAALLIGVTALGVFLAYFELETAQGFYPVQMEDWQKHYGVAFALRQSGVPPVNPFFYGMFPDEPLVYYYFLHLNGATFDLLQGGRLFLHQAFVTAMVLASLVFSAVFYLLAQTVLRSQKAALWSLAFATVIGGLDIIPIVHQAIETYRENFPAGPLPSGVFLPRDHIDNWVSALALRLNTFYAHHVWVPQHLTGLTILCLGCYLYLRVRERRKLLVILPLLLFALLGHSTWIAVIVCGCLFLFALFDIFSTFRHNGLDAARHRFLSYATIAAAFALIAAPFILSLLGNNGPKSGIAFVFPQLNSWLLLRPFENFLGLSLWTRLLDLPIHFLIELGLLLIAGLGGFILFWRHQKQPDKSIATRNFILNPSSPTPQPANLPIFQSPTPPTSHSLLPFWLLLLLTGFLTVTLFASGRGWEELGLILNNDLGLRALMPGQVVLALFGGYFVSRMFASKWKLLLAGPLALLIGLGLASTAWEFTAMGLTKYWLEPQLAPDVYHTLRTMPEVTAPQDKPLPVVAHRLHRDAARFQLSLGGRPVAFSTGEAVVFHREVQDLALALELSKQAFDNGLPVWSYQMFRTLGADYIFVGPAEREALRHPEKYEHLQYFQQVFEQGDFEIYRVQPPSYGQEAPQTFFDGGAIQFEGYFLDTAPLYPGRLAPPDGPATGLVTAWRLTQPTAKNYTAFIHFVDEQGHIIAQADHQLWAWDVIGEGPTSTWTPHLTHLDIVPIPAEALAADSFLTIRLGLWLPDTGEQFPVETLSLEVDEGGRLVVGRLGL